MPHERDGVEARFVGLAAPGSAPAGAGGHPCQGLYWTPAGEARPKTALIASHYNVDFAEHYLAPHMARAGFGFLGWNTRFRGAEDQFLLEPALVDIGAGVRWLREEAGAERIVILGNSGGGSLMGAYQAEALAPTLAGNARGPAAEALASLPAADLYISLNAHRGRPEVLTDWLDASVIDEGDPLATDESLNPYNRANGPPYGPEFVERYRAAQRARNQRITDQAKAELARLNAGGTPDAIFPLFRTWADLRFSDPALDPSDRPCPACYAGDPRRANRGLGIGRASGLRSWLSMWSLEASKCGISTHLPKIAQPALVVQALADTGVFPSDARSIFETLGSADKALQFVPGAHYFEDSEKSRAGAVEAIVEWLRERG